MANVLLVDDDGSVLLTLAIALRRYGHQVTVASDARQALLHLKRNRFAFLVSDVRMPGMSGVELASRARRLQEPPRIILTSAYSNVHVREGLVDAFLQKPIDTDRLNALLRGDGTTSPALNGSGREVANGSTGNGSTGNGTTGSVAKANGSTSGSAASRSAAHASSAHASRAHASRATKELSDQGAMVGALIAG